MSAVLAYLAWSLVWVLARALMALAAALIAFLGVNAVQQQFLPASTSFDSGFGRLSFALAIGAIAGVAAVMLVVRLGASRFTPGARIAQSCVALALAAPLILIWLKR